MAAAKKAEKAGALTIKKILDSTPPLSHAEMSQVLMTFFHCDSSGKLPPVWHEDKLSMARCPVLIGDAGCGKTTKIRQLCRKLGMEMRFMPTGAALDEDGLGIPEKTDQSNRDQFEHDMWMATHPEANPSESPVFKRYQTVYDWTDAEIAAELSGKKKKTGAFEVSKERAAEIGGKGMSDSFRTKPPGWWPGEPPKSPSGMGVLFIDELLTASDMQQNQISLAITNRGYGGMNFAPGWFIVGASNPPTDAYYLSKDPDARLLARLWLLPVVPTPDETMRYFSDNHVLSDRLYGFLLMNKHFITAVDNRTWEDAGYFEMQHMSAGIMAPAVFRTVMQYRLNPDLVAAYEAYCKFGDDPYYYPITAMSLMNATEEEHKVHMSVTGRWVKDQKSAHIGASAHDLIKYLSDPDFKLKDAMARKIGGFLGQLPNSDLIANICDNMPSGPNAALLYTHLCKSPVASKLKEFYELDRASTADNAFKRIPGSKKSS